MRFEKAQTKFIETAEKQIQKNVPKRFWTASMESFHATIPDMEEIKTKVLEFVSNPEGKSLVMIGRPGTGKTRPQYKPFPMDVAYDGKRYIA